MTNRTIAALSTCALAPLIIVMLRLGPATAQQAPVATSGADPARLAAFVSAISQHTKGGGYQGYRYKLLTSQGAAAPGGAYSYLVNGVLFGGFAVLAWPVTYGETGIKSFMVSHDGQVYERDLGRDSASRAASIDTFDPGPGWSKVSPQALAPMP